VQHNPKGSGSGWKKVQWQVISAGRDRFRTTWRQGRLTAPLAQPSKTTEKSGYSRIERTRIKGASGGTDEHATGLGYFLQPGGDVDDVTMNAAVVEQEFNKMYPDTKTDPLIHGE
jgi:hypothetical protein